MNNELVALPSLEDSEKTDRMKPIMVPDEASFDFLDDRQKTIEFYHLCRDFAHAQFTIKLTKNSNGKNVIGTEDTMLTVAGAKIVNRCGVIIFQPVDSNIGPMQVPIEAVHDSKLPAINSAARAAQRAAETNVDPLLLQNNCDDQFKVTMNETKMSGFYETRKSYSDKALQEQLQSGKKYTCKLICRSPTEMAIRLVCHTIDRVSGVVIGKMLDFDLRPVEHRLDQVGDLEYDSDDDIPLSQLMKKMSQTNARAKPHYPQQLKAYLQIVIEKLPEGEEREEAFAIMRRAAKLLADDESGHLNDYTPVIPHSAEIADAPREKIKKTAVKKVVVAVDGLGEAKTVSDYYDAVLKMARKKVNEMGDAFKKIASPTDKDFIKKKACTQSALEIFKNDKSVYLLSLDEHNLLISHLKEKLKMDDNDCSVVQAQRTRWRGAWKLPSDIAITSPSVRNSSMFCATASKNGKNCNKRPRAGDGESPTPSE